MHHPPVLFGAIEAGGTKMICAIGDAHGSRETVRIATGHPDETIDAIITFLQAAQTRHGPLAAIGIASFGPLDLDPVSPGHGSITTTPKPGWQGVNLPARVGKALGLPAGIDTDVNAAALAETRIGAAKGARSAAYVTIGTGIGVGMVIDGAMVHGLGHPEAGHLLPRRDPRHGAFPGICPYHGDCLEGLASGPAIAAAWGNPADSLGADHPAWAIEADYIGQLCATLILTIAPEHIVLGGGVMEQTGLIAAARHATLGHLAGYAALWNEKAVATRITTPGCAEPSGLVGAYLLAERARTAKN